MSKQARSLSFSDESIVDTVRQPLLVLSADLRVLKANASFYRTFRVKPEETVGQLIYDLGNQHWRIPALRKLLEEILPENLEFEDFEVYHDFPKLGRKAMLLNARRISQGNSPTEFILLAIEDITERRWIRYFNLSHDLLCVATLDGYFVEVNPSFTRALGHSRDDLVAKPFANFIHRDDIEKTAKVMDDLGSGTDLNAFRNRYRCKDGSYRWLEWTCPAALPGEQFLYAAARDITDTVFLEVERQRLNTELTRSNADLQQFAYVASHDLQEPLRAVSGCVQIIDKRYRSQLDVSAEELIGHTVDGVRRMQTLISDLLDFSRIAKPGDGFVSTDLDLALGEALANLEASIRETDARVTRDPLPTILADRGQMTRLFQNLVGNALKFRGSSKPIINIGVHRADHAWRFSVRDNGIGIQKDYFDRIFVLFQRLHTRDKYPGTGIGLAICKKIVERHGGLISVESAPGVGSTFSFTVPDKEVRSESSDPPPAD
jgi:PAS domain S-box-containing protein